VRDLVAHLRARAGREVDVGRALYGGMINLVSSTFFSVDVVDMDAAGEAAHGIRHHVESIADLMTKPNISDILPFLRRLDLQGRRRAAAWHLGEIYRILDGIIERRLAENAEDGRHGDDFLQVLLDLMSTGKIDRDTVKAIVFEVFLTGGDTITVTVEWAMAELLRNPGAMARLRAEIAGALGGMETIEEPDVAGLPYLQAVFKESMRLHPVAPLLVPHKAVEDGVEVCGYAVPKGCTVFINVWAIMRDPAVWDEPDKFMPERFLDRPAAEVDYRGKNFEFFPFGYGVRQCPGMPMAERVVPHLLASLLHAFEWRLPEGMAPEQLDVSERFTTGNVLAVPLKAVPVAIA
jgi:cytochrome P450